VAAAGRDAAADVPAELELWFALTFSFGSFAEAAEAADRALAAACELEDGALLASALAVSTASELLFRGAGLDEARLEQALALEDLDVPCPLERRPSFLLGLVLASVDELPRARDVLGALRDGLVERGEENDLPDVLALLARVECLTGKLAAAAVLADRGFELAVQAGSDTHAAIARAMRALIDAHAGRVEATRGAAEGAIALAAVSGSQIAAFVARSALGLLELSVGNDAAVVATLAHSIALVEENGLVEPSRVPFLPDAIEALVGLGELDRAESLTRRLEERGRVLDRPSAIVAGARCRALVLAARGDVADALAAVERGLAAEARLPVPLEVARTLIVKGQLERRRKQKRQSRASLERALTLCEQIGAALWAERARGELSRLGRGPDPYDLTATEERVARLAASGRTNREIAATAFISQKTVEANLSRVYRKLGVRSRAELGLSLVERDREDRSRVSPDSAIPGGS
jgi:DNA-binding NarL/FixJ family response regulator